MDEEVDIAIGLLAPAAAAIAKLPPDEAGEVRAWLLEIARAVGDASKGTSDAETATVDRIRAAISAS
jgi:hypothetical protein